jgi:hypothetical protein
MAAEARCMAGRWDAGIASWTALASRAESDASREQAEDAAQRCAFERDAFGEPVQWDGDWPGR